MARVNRIEYLCPDGETRLFDSMAEVEFIQYCEKVWIKILEYNTDKHKKYKLFDKPPESARSKRLEKILNQKSFLSDLTRMRSMQASYKSFDFHIEIAWVEFLCDIKSNFTNKNNWTLSMSEKSYYTTWAMTKAIMASVYKMPIIVFIANDKRMQWVPYREWNAEYFLPEHLVEKIENYEL